MWWEYRHSWWSGVVEYWLGDLQRVTRKWSKKLRAEEKEWKRWKIKQNKFVGEKNDERKTTNYYRKTHSQLYTHKPKNNSRKKWQPKKFIDFLTRRRRRRLPAAPLPKNWEKQATQTTTNIALNERATVASSSPKMTSTAFVFVSSKRSELHCCEKSFIIRIRTYLRTTSFG